jgi:hypothetical protein
MEGVKFVLEKRYYFQGGIGAEVVGMRREMEGVQMEQRN